MKAVVIAMMLFAQTGIASAQTAPVAAAAATSAPGTLATARKLTALLHLNDQYDRMFEPLLPVIVSGILPAMEKDAALPATVRAELATTEGKARIGRIVGEELIRSFRARYPEMAEETTRQYAGAFTEEELAALVTFYSSGAGAKALLLIPQLTAKLRGYGQTVGEQAGREAYGEVLRRLDPSRTS